MKEPIIDRRLLSSLNFWHAWWQLLLINLCTNVQPYSASDIFFINLNEAQTSRDPVPPSSNGSQLLLLLLPLIASSAVKGLFSAWKEAGLEWISEHWRKNGCGSWRDGLQRGCRWGASINDVRKYFCILDPSPLSVLHLRNPSSMLSTKICWKGGTWFGKFVPAVAQVFCLSLPGQCLRSRLSIPFSWPL